MIEYDTWTCKVTKSRNFEIECWDQSDQAISLYGMIEPIGRFSKTKPVAHLSPVACKEYRSAGGRAVNVSAMSLDADGKEAIQGLWPLATGKQAVYRIHYDIPMGYQVIESEVEVIGRETVTSGRRSYDTFVVEQTVDRFCATNDSTNHDVDAGDYRRKLWIDAKRHFIVKDEFQWTSGFRRGKRLAYELVSVKFPADAPAMAQAAPRSAAAPPVQTAVQVDVDQRGPTIAVSESIETTKPVVAISGRITDESRIIEVQLDGRPVPMKADGTIALNRAVPSGTSTFVIAAYDEWGNTSQQSVTVTRAAATVPKVVVEPRAAPKPVAKVAADETAPVIEVPGSLSTTGRTIELAGRVSDASRVVEVTVEGRPVALAADGAIVIKRAVSVGSNTIRVTAVDEWGNRAEARIAVERRRPFADINFGTYHAIIICNNDYAGMPKLKSAVNDAQAVAQALKQDYGFTVDLLINAARSDIINALAAARKTLKANDNLLIYYAGHGVLDTYAEEGYWLPVDAEPDSPANWVSNSDITNMLRAIRAKHVMVVADSCYSGTLVRAINAKIDTAKERKAWLKKMVKKRTRTALVSGGLEPVIDSGGGGHSVFAKAFLDALRANEDVLEAEKLFSLIKRPVALESGQTPEYSDVRRAGHDGGDFMFVRK